MKPNEKAKELVYKYRKGIKIPSKDYEKAKLCALICVDEILRYENLLVEVIGSDMSGYTPKYWKEVKEQIRSL